MIQYQEGTELEAFRVKIRYDSVSRECGVRGVPRENDSILKPLRYYAQTLHIFNCIEYCISILCILIIFILEIM